MFKKYVGIDFIDFVIQFVATIPASVILSSLTAPEEELGVSVAVIGSLLLLAWRRARGLKEQPQAALTTGEVQLERVAYVRSLTNVRHSSIDALGFQHG